MPDNKVSLATLGGGSAIERFDYELQRVLNNIADTKIKDFLAGHIETIPIIA